ncbi:hypothetical protein NFI96_005528, partial [Prochilodus magdalenae]
KLPTEFLSTKYQQVSQQPGIHGQTRQYLVVLDNSLYLGNPMDPPDVLGLDLNVPRPTQLPGRAKKDPPPRPPQPALLFKKPTYDPVTEDEDLTSSGLRRLSLKKASMKSLKLKPAAWVSATKPVYGLRAPGGSILTEVSLIDFGEEVPSATPSPSPVVETHVPTLAKLSLDAENLLDGTPPQSPSQTLPRPLHPTPVVDWDSRPLPPPPAYDDVAQDEDDFEVSSINSAEPGSPRAPCTPTEEDKPLVEDNLFLPRGQSRARTFSQSAEIFQELQQECMRRLNVPNPELYRQIVLNASEDKPQIPPRIPIPPRPPKNPGAEYSRWSGELSPGSGVEEDKVRPPQIPPRDPLSQPGSRTPSPMGLYMGSHCSPASIYGSPYLSTSPGKLMPTTQSFASDPKYAAPKVIQAQGKDKEVTKGPCILPIVRDGKKVSNTHYYLLPERPSYLDRYDKFFKEAETGEERRSLNMATVRPMVQQQQQGEPKSNFSSNNNSSLVDSSGRAGVKNSLSLPRMTTDGSVSRVEGGCTSDRVKLVQDAVHGVTIEECQTALQNHSWSVQKAVHYLKVEQLFCLGLKTRVECHKILEMYDWNLELASTQLLDSYGSVKQR